MRHYQLPRAVLMAVLLAPSVSLAQLPNGLVWKDTIKREYSVGFSVNVTDGMVIEKYELVAVGRLRESASLHLSVIDADASKRLAFTTVEARKDMPGRWVVTDCAKLKKPGRYYVVITTPTGIPANIAHSLGVVTARLNAKADDDLITEVVATPREGKTVFKVNFRVSGTATVVCEAFEDKTDKFNWKSKESKFEKGRHFIDWDAMGSGAGANKYRLEISGVSNRDRNVIGKGMDWVIVKD